MERFNSNHSDQEYLKDRYRWIQFFIERFDPLSHLVMISLFIAGHVALSGQGISLNIILILLGTTIFFFKLRCFDEVKDLDLDMVINSSRPLPRGLLTVFHMKDAILLCLIFENIIFYNISFNAGVSMTLASIYSLIMYKEFFIGTKFRDKLTSYATAHTIVTIFLSISIFCALVDRSFYDLDTKIYSFSVMSWLLFNIFELGRKTYLESEERDQVESYSKVWGKLGAVVLVLFHAILVLTLLFIIINYSSFFSYYYFGSSLLIFLILGVILLMNTKGKAGAMYRGYSSFFIILIYLGVVLEKII